MATAAELSSNIATLQAALADGGGMASISVDGQTVQFRGPTEIIKAIDYYRSLEGRASGRRPRCASIQLPGS